MNIENIIFFIWSFFYFYNYGPPSIVLNFFIRFYHFYNNFFEAYNKLIYPLLWIDENNDENVSEKIKNVEEEPILKKKYEDKYLDDIRQLNKEWIFTEEEQQQIPKLIEDFLNGYIESKQVRIEEIKTEIANLESQISQDTNDVDYIEKFDEEGDEVINQTTLEERNKERRNLIQTLQEECNKLNLEIQSDDGLSKLKIESENQANQYIINNRIDKLKNCYIMEKTPIGNIIMIYNKEKESFKYYADCNIPYRYLEVVSRKYVKFFNCRPIFVDMEEELKLFEEKWEKEQELKKIKQIEDEKRKSESQNQNTEIKKKNVFAKFKSYNKDAGGKISMAPPPKNSISNTKRDENKENEKILLKERANRYTYEGKFANFNFLQKIDKKAVNKKLGLSFADFKKMQQK